MNTSFSCVTCGKCCNDHHVPLTLCEARDWAAEGGNLIILVEAFLPDGPGVAPDQYEHARLRSCVVPCGDTQAYVAITFAAYNPGPCRHLDEQHLCRIYDRRPLVCRIYPMEINPHIPLRPHAKECPPEAWQSGTALIHGGKLVDSELIELIERSRQADRDDIRHKEALCQHLGIRVTALKGDGFTAYLPAMCAFIDALNQVQAPDEAAAPGTWTFHTSGADITEQLHVRGAQVTHEAPVDYAFISLRAA